MRCLFLMGCMLFLFSCTHQPSEVFFDLEWNKILKAGAPKYIGEPCSNEGTNLLAEKDGSIKFIYRKGDWDNGGFTHELFQMSTIDQGRSWTQPRVIGSTGPGKQCFATISPVSGEVIVFFINRQKNKKGNYRFVRTQNNRTDWSYNKRFDTIPFGGMGYGSCLWIDMPNNHKRVLCGVHGQGKGAGCYFSDDDGLSWKPSNRAYVPDLIPNIWHTSSVEPAFVEMNDGRIWMLMRTSNDRLWESYSSDRGETWSKAKPSIFSCGPNSWVSLKKLSTGEILLVWNNAMSMPPCSTQDQWSFTNRDLIHAAISPNDGKNWYGFREVYLDRMRDSSRFVNHPGDKGVNESKLAETPQGNILIACGQAPGHRAFVLLDPHWLYQRSAYNDFSDSLKYWSTHKLIARSPVYSRWYHYNYNRKRGAALVDHPNIPGKKVLHIRRLKDSTVLSQRDGGVWNFPAGKSGTFQTRIYLNKGFGGARIVLNDRWYQPSDSQGEASGMFSLDIPASGNMGNGIILQKEKWHNILMKWDGVGEKDKSGCIVQINGSELPQKLRLKNTSSNGISYVRFRSTALWPDSKGVYVEYVKADVQPK